MPRRTAEVSITAEGRDIGKTFIVTEMAADQAERWSIRLLLAAMRSGVDIPDDLAAQGVAALPAIGLRALMGVNYFEIEPLLDEMMACVTIKEKLVVRPVAPSDIEETVTRLQLRMEVWKMHTGFFQAVAGLLPRPPTTTPA